LFFTSYSVTFIIINAIREVKLRQPTTAKLILKGYSLTEGVKALGICLKTYRNMIKNNPDKLNKMITELKDLTNNE